MTTIYQEKRSTLIHIPATNTVSTSITVGTSSQQAWGIVGDFSGFHKFIDGLERIEMTGEGTRAVRKKFFEDGHVVLEQLNNHSDDAMVMDWSLIYTNMDINNLWSSMRVEPVDSENCKVIWDIAGEPFNKETSQVDFDAFIASFATAALQNVKKLVDPAKAA